MRIFTRGPQLAIQICSHRIHELGWDQEPISSLMARATRRGVQILHHNGQLGVDVPADARSDDVLLAAYLAGSERSKQVGEFMASRERAVEKRKVEK